MFTVFSHLFVFSSSLRFLNEVDRNPEDRSRDVLKDTDVQDSIKIEILEVVAMKSILQHNALISSRKSRLLSKYLTFASRKHYQFIAYNPNSGW